MPASKKDEARAKLAIRGKKVEQRPAEPKVITFKSRPNPPIPTAPILKREPTTDEEKKAVSEYDSARARLLKYVSGDKGAERVYGIAYQKLVALGLAPQLKGKYRA
jgi:hypothetical protein